MSHLVILIHADPSVRPKYEAQLPPGCDLAIINAGGFSSAYKRLAIQLGGTLAGVVRHAGHELARHETVTLASFSAGYALVRAVLEDSADHLDAVVGIDSWHAGLDGDGTARDSQLEGLVRFAKSGKVCWIAHTDVRTPQSGANAFASTSQVAAELRRLTGLPAVGTDVSDGGLRVRAVDQHTSDHDEHIAALNDWGPKWLGDAVRELLCRRSDAVPDTVPAPPPQWHDGIDLEATTLGGRCCAWLGFQFGLKPREIPGPEHNQIILTYSKHCRRGGRLIGVTADNLPIWEGGKPLSLPTDDSDSPWCAALASATLLNALLPSETPPHGLRVSVRELVEDARAAGTLMPADWVPTPGSLAILGRAGENPLHGGRGHVRAVLGVDGSRYLGLGGNEDDTISLAWHQRSQVLAWITR